MNDDLMAVEILYMSGAETSPNTKIKQQSASYQFK